MRKQVATQIVVHVLHALQQSMKSIEIQTVDTYVIVILISRSDL